MFLKTIGEDHATGEIAEIYAGEKSKFGFVMSATACWTTRPDMLPVWEDFFAKVKANFTLSMRDWRLITFIVAKKVPSAYCSMVYAGLLQDDLGSKDKVMAVHKDFHAAGLDERDVAMLDFAEKIAIDASKVTHIDIDGLRAAGFSDPQISDIALCAALRCFMSRFYDATGATPEPAFIDDDPEVASALAVGRQPN
ncbi:MAG: alkylhydroperoxidase [Pseudomonadota bacterium]